VRKAKVSAQEVFGFVSIIYQSGYSGAPHGGNFFFLRFFFFFK